MNLKPEEIKPGATFNCPYELVAPVEAGQEWFNGDQKLITLTNLRGNLWWSRSLWCPHKRLLLVCTDQLEAIQESQAKRLLEEARKHLNVAGWSQEVDEWLKRNK